MEVSCRHCQTRFRLSDEKVPRDRAFALTCPKCRQKFTVDPRTGDPAAAGALLDEVSGAGYDDAERPFDFIEEGAQTAIICENDPEYRPRIQAALKEMGFYITAAASARDVLKQMRFHNFDLVVINERFDAPDPDRNSVLRYLERLGMNIRRNIFVVLLSDRFRTMDNMAAFHKSVNLVIHLGDLDQLAKILKRGFSDHRHFYRAFHEAMTKAGRG
jgi:predicted Zn finger-like uncharacterized protein